MDRESAADGACNPAHRPAPTKLRKTVIQFDRVQTNGASNVSGRDVMQATTAVVKIGIPVILWKHSPSLVQCHNPKRWVDGEYSGKRTAV
jgi:hypothetical protein